jgi:hypothetical protein
MVCFVLTQPEYVYKKKVGREMINAVLEVNFQALVMVKKCPLQRYMAPADVKPPQFILGRAKYRGFLAGEPDPYGMAVCNKEPEDSGSDDDDDDDDFDPKMDENGDECLTVPKSSSKNKKRSATEQLFDQGRQRFRTAVTAAFQMYDNIMDSVYTELFGPPLHESESEPPEQESFSAPDIEIVVEQPPQPPQPPATVRTCSCCGAEGVYVSTCGKHDHTCTKGIHGPNPTVIDTLLIGSAPVDNAPIDSAPIVSVVSAVDMTPIHRSTTSGANNLRDGTLALPCTWLLWSDLLCSTHHH